MVDHPSLTEVGPSPQPGGRLLHNLLLFGRVCKRLGLDAAPGRMIEAARAVQSVNLGSRLEVYHALFHKL